MILLNRLLLIIAFILSLHQLAGQTCQSADYLGDVLTDPLKLQIWEQRAKELQSVQSESTVSGFLRETITLPIVIHVVWYTPEENISDEQIHSQIEVLNRDFLGLNGDAARIPKIFRSLVADVGFEFCLATMDPSGQPTDGIIRRQASMPAMGREKDSQGRVRVHYDRLGGSDPWPSDRYINIWITDLGGGFIGKATMPGLAMFAEEDGLIIDPRYFGTTGLARASYPFHLGRTATHEMGHYFNLSHIWGDDNGSCNTDDGIDDTPLQAGSYSGCPDFPQSSCNTNDMFMNFMDRVDDACMHFFTIGQRNVMHAALQGPRAGLMNGHKCDKVGAIADIENAVNFLFGRNHVTISFDLPVEGKVDLSIFDVSGRRIFRKNDYRVQILELDSTQIPSGIYFLTINHHSGTITKKFMIL